MYFRVACTPCRHITAASCYGRAVSFMVCKVKFVYLDTVDVTVLKMALRWFSKNCDYQWGTEVMCLSLLVFVHCQMSIREIMYTTLQCSTVQNVDHNSRFNIFSEEGRLQSGFSNCHKTSPQHFSVPKTVTNKIICLIFTNPWPPLLWQY